MNRKQIGIIFALSLIAFLFYAILPKLILSDSPYFFLMGCGQEFPDDHTPVLSKALFQSLPCNLLIFKLLVFVCIFLSSLVVAKTGELFNKEHGWLAGVFVFACVTWLNFHYQIEDDLLAYPLLFFANYLFLKGSRANRNRYKFASVLLAIGVGLLVWKGALLYIAIYSFFFAPALIVLFFFLIYIDSGALHKILFGDGAVLENMNALDASLRLGSGWLGFGHGIGFLGANIFVKPVWLAVAFFVVSLFNIKWSIHVAPFLGIGLMLLAVEVDKKKNAFWKPANNWLDKRLMENVLLSFVGVVFVYLIVSRAIFFAADLYLPTQTQLEAVAFLVEKGDGGLVANDWSYGYLVLMQGGNTKNYGGGGGDPFLHVEDARGLYALTENPDGLPCELIRTWEKKGFYGSDIKLYKC